MTYAGFKEVWDFDDRFCVPLRGLT